jgi:acyl carrier protein
MSTESVELLVRQTIAKRLQIDISDIQSETSFEDLKLDSLDLAELFFLLEDEMNKPINVGPNLDLVTVRDVVQLILKTH